MNSFLRIFEKLVVAEILTKSRRTGSGWWKLLAGMSSCIVVLNLSSLTGKICGSLRPKQAIYVFWREFTWWFSENAIFWSRIHVVGLKGSVQVVFGLKRVIVLFRDIFVWPPCIKSDYFILFCNCARWVFKWFFVNKGYFCWCMELFDRQMAGFDEKKIIRVNLK